jgi:deoxyribonuclease (pyrimidine dimer)
VAFGYLTSLGDAMTRINVIPPNMLSGKHLIAEFHELPRIFGLAAKSSPSVSIPSDYCMGEGHVKFFYNKLSWLEIRCKALIAEMKLRGYKTSYDGDFSALRSQTRPELWGDWTPTIDAINKNVFRLFERDSVYYSFPSSAEKAIISMGLSQKQKENNVTGKTRVDLRGRKGVWSKHFLTAKVEENPRRPGTRGRESLQIIMENPGISTEMYMNLGGRHQDLKWDIEHDYVEAVPF